MMKKIVFIYGLIAGLITLPMLILLVTVGKDHQGVGSSLIIGYSSMFLAFTMVFFGVRAYRNNYLGGKISFWKALGIGCLIAFVGSTFYVIAWAILSQAFYPEFADTYTEAYIEQLKKKDLSAEALQKQIDTFRSQMEFYKTPGGFVAFTYLEILTVGIPVAVISAIILWLTGKKKKPGTE